MTAGDETHDHQLRCQPYMLKLRMLASVEAGLAPTAAEIGRTTGAIIAEVGAASRAVLAAAGDGCHHPGAGPFLQARLNRLTAAADQAIAAARDGDSAALRRVLHRFETLTSAIWMVHDAVRGPAASARLASGQRRREPIAASVPAEGARTGTQTLEWPPSAGTPSRMT
jgi:hypothetical protein